MVQLTTFSKWKQNERKQICQCQAVWLFLLYQFSSLKFSFWLLDLAGPEASFRARSCSVCQRWSIAVCDLLPSYVNVRLCNQDNPQNKGHIAALQLVVLSLSHLILVQFSSHKHRLDCGVYFYVQILKLRLNNICWDLVFTW